MRWFIIFLIVPLLGPEAQAQEDTLITEEKVRGIMEYLSSDQLKGRGNFTPELHLAARYIAEHFENNALARYPGEASYLIPFNKASLRNNRKDPIRNQAPGQVLYNVVGVLEGKRVPEEVIIFAAHFDHLGSKKRSKKDGIYNGANDNASGTAAVMMLAQYFAKESNNERTIIFCAFAGEELGLLGSKDLVKKINTGTNYGAGGRR